MGIALIIAFVWFRIIHVGRRVRRRRRMKIGTGLCVDGLVVVVGRMIVVVVDGVV
jgi:hypothetical protein